MLTRSRLDTDTDVPVAPASGVDISVRDIVKAFDGHTALRGVNLDIERGELLALLGPSGSGKTTLLRVIAGLEAQSAGNVSLGGRDATWLSVQERNVGFVFQHYALFRNMSIFENVAYGLRVRPRRTRPPESEIRKRVNGLLELVQLDGLNKRYPAQLSGGQRQRVALARALATEPRVLLLDEPFGALDARVRKELRRWLRDIHAKTGQTTIFVTHDQDEAMELADRVAILNLGRIEQIGRPEEIYAEPSSAFIASFVGDATILGAHVTAGQARVGKHIIGGAPVGTPDGAARLFARAGEVGLLPAASGVPATVAGLSWTAHGRRARVAIDDVATGFEVDVPAGVDLAAGDRIGLSFRRVRLFPA